jgi:hypothetical protein
MLEVLAPHGVGSDVTIQLSRVVSEVAEDLEGTEFRGLDEKVHELSAETLPILEERLNQFRMDVAAERVSFQQAKEGLNSVKPQYPIVDYVNVPEYEAVYAKYEQDRKEWEAKYTTVQSEHSARMEEIYSNIKHDAEDILDSQELKEHWVNGDGHDFVYSKFSENFEPDSESESMAMDEWISEQQTEEEEFEVSAETIRSSTIYRSVNADIEEYVPSAAESWSLQESKSKEFGSKTMEDDAPDPRKILVFQGSKNWKAEAGGFGHKEAELIMLSDLPSWVPRDADGDGNLEEDADESDEVYTENTEEEGGE